MAFIAYSSKIKNTSYRSESLDETLHMGRGQLEVSFKKKIRCGEPWRERQLNFEKNKIFERL